MLKWLFFFMKWCNVFIQLAFFCKVVSHMLNIGFLPLWTDPMCIFKLPFLVKLASHMLHLKDFFPSWTDAICSFNYPFCVKLESHMLHLNGIFLHAMCSFNLLFSAKLVSCIEMRFSFMNWCNVSIHLLLLCKGWSSYVRMTFFLHELMQCVHSTCFFFWKASITCCIWKASFFHELMPCVYSSLPFV